MANTKNTKTLYDKVVSALSDKKTVPDYTTMCQLLDEPNYEKKGGTKSKLKKKQQLNYWKFCFKWVTRKDAFTSIRIYSLEEYHYNILKFLSQESIYYSFYAFLSLYYQYSGGDICYLTKNDLATALCLCNENFKKFHRDIISYGETLESYALNIQENESAYNCAQLPKKEIEENLNSNSDNHITSRTYHIVNDYDLHVSENIKYLIESLLTKANKENLPINRITYIGGFVDMQSIPVDADLTDIYQENGIFYLRLKNNNPLVLQYKERALTSDEINLYVKLQSEVIHSMGYSGFREIKNSNRIQDLQDKMAPMLFQRMHILFAYQACEIFVPSILMQTKKEEYKKNLDNFFNITKLKKSLALSNETNKKKILDLKQNRQLTEATVDTKKKFLSKHKVTYSQPEDRKQDELNKQYDFYMYQRLTEDLIQVDINRFCKFFESFNDLDHCPDVWKKLFEKSLDKAKNGKNLS